MKTRRTIMTLQLIALLGAIPGGAMADGEDRRELRDITLAGGCFWCLEAVFDRLEGVHAVVSGYAGGGSGPVSYEAVCSGTTDFAEVVRVTYDPRRIAVEDLLAVFFAVHDPTTPNRQGADVGPQYRSAIFWHDETQRDAARSAIADLTGAKVFADPVVTEVTPLDAFTAAETYHQDYYRNNPSQPYCRMVIAPKVEKFRKMFTDRLK